MLLHWIKKVDIVLLYSSYSSWIFWLTFCIRLNASWKTTTKHILPLSCQKRLVISLVISWLVIHLKKKLASFLNNSGDSVVWRWSWNSEGVLFYLECCLYCTCGNLSTVLVFEVQNSPKINMFALIMLQIGDKQNFVCNCSYEFCLVYLTLNRVYLLSDSLVGPT